MTERIIIFTMEKVGSSTVKWALEHAGYLVDRVTPHNALDFVESLGTQKVITMVRDPIAHSLSLQFEYLKTLGVGFSNISVKQFMGTNLKLSTEIDVLKYYFDTSKGWQIYDERLLLIRTENLTSDLEDALTTFLGPGDYLIDHRARGADRFGPGYVAYIEEFKPENWSLEQMYDDNYVQHFYTPEEIEGFKQRWAIK